MAYRKTLIHNWNFSDIEKSDDERLTDTIMGVKAQLGYNALLEPDGVFISYGSKDYMKAYVYMENVISRGCYIEVDVASFNGNWDASQHGRFIMFDDSSTSFDEGLIFNANRKQWAFYDSSNGWSDSFPSLEMNSFSEKTVGIEILEDGTTSLYVDDELIGVSTVKTSEKNVNLILGAAARAATGSRISHVRVYTLTPELFFTVKFYDKDGQDVISEQLILQGESAIAPPPRKHNGFIFIEWIGSYTDVQSNLNIYSKYREVSTKPLLNFYKANEDGSSGELIKSYNAVNGCSIVQKLDGECTMEFTLMTQQIEGIISIKDRVEVDGLVFYINEISKNISNGICYTKMSGDHISFLLNDEKYMVQTFEMADTPKNIITTLLADTPFTVGEVDFTKKVSLLINKEVTRRACLMQLIAQLGAEIEYDGYSIGIRKHVGSQTPKDIMKSSLVQDISYSHSISSNTTNYTLSLYQKGNLHLGDELKVAFKPLAIDTNSRIVGMEWNPFNYKEASITIGQYIPTVNDSLYEIANEVSDIRESNAKYTMEFGEMIGNGTFYFTRSYRDRPYFHIHTNDGTVGEVELIKLDTYQFNPYIGARLSGVNSSTSTLLVFYCTVPVDNE